MKLLKKGMNHERSDGQKCSEQADCSDTSRRFQLVCNLYLFYSFYSLRSLRHQLQTKPRFAKPCLFTPNQLMETQLIFFFCYISKDLLKIRMTLEWIHGYCYIHHFVRSIDEQILSLSIFLPPQIPLLELYLFDTAVL